MIDELKERADQIESGIEAIAKMPAYQRPGAALTVTKSVAVVLREIVDEIEAANVRMVALEAANNIAPTGQTATENAAA